MAVGASVACPGAWHVLDDPTGGSPLLRAIVARIVAIVTGGDGRRRTSKRRRGPVGRVLDAVRGLFGGRRRR